MIIPESLEFEEGIFNEIYHEIDEAFCNDAIRFIFIYGGSSSCFAPCQLIVTDKGGKPISEIEIGDNVLSFNEELGINEFKKVTNTFKFINDKPTVKIKLRSGEEIICTEDHKFYYKGGFVMIKHLLSLQDGR